MDFNPALIVTRLPRRRPLWAGAPLWLALLGLALLGLALLAYVVTRIWAGSL